MLALGEVIVVVSEVVVVVVVSVTDSVFVIELVGLTKIFGRVVTPKKVEK